MHTELKQILFIFIAVAWLTLLSSCASGMSAEDLSLTIVAQTVTAASPTANLPATAQLAAQVETQVVQTEAAIQTATSVASATRSAIQTATSQAATIEAYPKSTAQAQSMADSVLELFSEGYISSTDGFYFALPEFDENLARLERTDSGWVQGVTYYWTDYLTGFEPNNFVIRADLSWKNVDEYANKFAGCGFTFRIDNETNDRYLIWLSGIGHVNLIRVFGSSELIGNVRYGHVGFPEGEAKMLLIVDGTDIRVFINDTYVGAFQDRYLDKGELGLAVVSGDNRSFGTRCMMDNIELWDLGGE